MFARLATRRSVVAAPRQRHTPAPRVAQRLGSSKGVNRGDSIIYGEEHKQLQQTVRNIIDNDINPFVDEWEEKGQFPIHEVFKKFGDAGIIGVNKPEKYGGSGLDYTYGLAVAEEIGNVRAGGVGMALGVQMDMATPALTMFGSHELKEQFLRPAISGDMVACIGVSEPSAGSDVAAIKTKAVLDESTNEWVINGSKMWITNGTTADWICLLCNTNDGKAHKNKSLIIVPMDTKGVKVEKKLDKLGMRCSDTALLFFDDVRVPAGNLIGEEGRGFQYQMIQFQLERLWAAASALKMMEVVIADCTMYVAQRKVFGRPLAENPVIQYTFGELNTEIEALRSLIYRAVLQHKAGEDVTELATMAKLKGGRLARQVCDKCLQYYGGMGFMNETPVTRALRDSRILSIGGGSDETMLLILAKLHGQRIMGGGL